MTVEIKVSVVVGDVRSFATDVLVLKYAQSLHGADREIYDLLAASQVTVPLPREFRTSMVRSDNTPVSAKNVLFVGVTPLRDFGYSEINKFASLAISSLASDMPHARTVALTIHGPGYGLDEIEAFRSELSGVVAALTKASFPEALREIYFVERNAKRASRLKGVLLEALPKGFIAVSGNPLKAALLDGRSESRNPLNTPVRSNVAKPYIFVAMPFAESMDDTFHYGIQSSVNAAGFLCERADLSSFTGDVVDWVKKRISNATLVVADLSSANPNVYLEVGFAWGQQIPTVLIAKDATDLTFDVKGQRCIFYKSIKQLEDSLLHELAALSI